MKKYQVEGLRAAAVTLAIAVLALTFVVPARAHDDDHHRLQGHKLAMRSGHADARHGKLAFVSKKQISINDEGIARIDPLTMTSNLLVHGSGSGDGTTSVIYLDPTRWSRLGTKGYKYKGDIEDPDSGGIKLIKLKSAARGGKLKIKAKGSYWDYYIEQPQQSVQLSLTVGDEVYCAEFSDLAINDDGGNGKVIGKDATPPADCFAVCGNGVLEVGEQCDDANRFDTDTCNNLCEGCVPGPSDFTTTYEGIQTLIFDSPTYQCSNDACHGSAMQGGLDLRAGASHAALVNVPSQIDPSVVRVLPGDQHLSMLYSKLAEKTLGTPDAPGTPMPANASTVSTDLLEALRLWIRGGAPETGVVDGTAELFGSCLPPPDPLKMPQPDPPAAGTGVQLAMPGWYLPAQSEDEICVPSYYDFDDPAIVPPQYRIPCPGLYPGTNDTDECFAWSTNFLAQDPQSHHSIVRIYAGDYDYTDPGWGTWHCYGGDDDGQACDPATPGVCPGGGVCGGTTRSGAGCLAFNPSFGPEDYSLLGNNAPQFSGAQEPTLLAQFPDGVYAPMPLKGVVVWNSHAFNLTNEDMTMQGWVNLGFTDSFVFPAQELFDDSYIFVQDVPPYEQREYCYTHTFPEGARLFELTSHMHKHGKRWRYYLPPQTPCQNASSCSPGSAGDIFYQSFDYSDPLELSLDPPMHFTGTAAERTIKFCALYDNGYTDPDEVKTQSGSPCPPNGCGGFIPGGPCTDAQVKCTVGGANTGQLCGGDDANCPGATCDACNLKGGVTTEDEMFIAIGQYYVDP
jgi:cysteine-rich repeat protein